MNKEEYEAIPDPFTNRAQCMFCLNGVNVSYTPPRYSAYSFGCSSCNAHVALLKVGNRRVYYWNSGEPDKHE